VLEVGIEMRDRCRTFATVPETCCQFAAVKSVGISVSALPTAGWGETDQQMRHLGLRRHHVGHDDLGRGHRAARVQLAQVDLRGVPPDRPGRSLSALPELAEV
jgi:hypothetical protein